MLGLPGLPQMDWVLELHVLLQRWWGLLDRALGQCPWGLQWGQLQYVLLLVGCLWLEQQHMGLLLPSDHSQQVWEWWGLGGVLQNLGTGGVAAAPLP